MRQNKPLKPKKCRVCKELFQPMNSLAVTCSIGCAVEKVKSDRLRLSKRAHKEFKAETRQMKGKLLTRSDWLKKAQISCNAYIRERDKNEGCISCGTRNPNIQYCAGHFKTRGGHPELRFHPWNLNKQCNHHCNLRLSGNISAYRPRLIEKIGLEAVEWLEGEQKPQNWDIEDIIGIRDYYKELRKNLMEERHD